MTTSARSEDAMIRLSVWCDVFIDDFLGHEDFG